MKNNLEKCYICGLQLKDKEMYYHKRCAFALFNSNTPPIVNYTWSDLNSLAKKVISNHISMPGVQPKLSLHIEKRSDTRSKRLTIVGFEGSFILKPPTLQYAELPQCEHFCMLFAGLCGIETALFGLIPLKSGELAYITKRMDRTSKGVLHMEDFCQLTGKLTEGKYRGSMEQIGKALRSFSDSSGLDAVRLFEITLFSFLIGNSDMHLKNFSLIRLPDGRHRLSPAYDLLPAKIILPEDNEELALTLNGKKNKIKRCDFEVYGNSLKMSIPQIKNAIRRISTKFTENLSIAINRSFLSDEKKKAVRLLAEERIKIL